MTTPTTPPRINASSPFASWKIDHAAIRVPDFETAIAWYTNKLDFQLRRSLPLAGLTFALISPAAEPSFTFELIAGPGADNRPAYEGLRASYGTSGWHHMGFRTDNVDGAIEALKRRDVTIVAEPKDVAAMGLRVAFFADPWGNVFEIVQSLGD